MSARSRLASVLHAQAATHSSITTVSALAAIVHGTIKLYEPESLALRHGANNWNHAKYYALQATLLLKCSS
jgi:hypothetical protein